MLKLTAVSIEPKWTGTFTLVVCVRHKPTILAMEVLALGVLVTTIPIKATQTVQESKKIQVSDFETSKAFFNKKKK